jgi:phage baseplate assembly protein W
VSTDFYGTGIAQPMSLSVTNGVLSSTGTDRVEQSIRVILGTQQGERVMRPDFGCNLRSLVFAPMNEATLNLARHYVLDGLTQWEPRIDVTDVVITPGPGQLIISVNYRLKATQQPGTLIYRFSRGQA